MQNQKKRGIRCGGVTFLLLLLAPTQRNQKPRNLDVPNSSVFTAVPLLAVPKPPLFVMFSRASMWQPCSLSSQTLCIPTEHPCGNHVNVQTDSVRSHRSSIYVATMLTSVRSHKASVSSNNENQPRTISRLLRCE